MSKAIRHLPRGCLSEWPDESDHDITDVNASPSDDPDCLPAAAHYLAAYGPMGNALTLAMRLSFASCRLESAASCADYGVLLMVNSDAEERQATAVRALQQACEMEDPRACTIMGFVVQDNREEDYTT